MWRYLALHHASPSKNLLWNEKLCVCKVMLLSAVRTLILTAPIHCRGSIDDVFSLKSSFVISGIMYRLCSYLLQCVTRCLCHGLFCDLMSSWLYMCCMQCVFDLMLCVHVSQQCLHASVFVCVCPVSKVSHSSCPPPGFESVSPHPFIPFHRILFPLLPVSHYLPPSHPIPSRLFLHPFIHQSIHRWHPTAWMISHAGL